EAADVLVADVGDLLEDELFDLGSGEALDDEAGPGVDEEVVAGADLLADEDAGELADALFVGAADDEDAALVFEDLFEDDDLPGDFEAAGQDHVEGLVEGDFLASFEGVDIDLGVD